MAKRSLRETWEKHYAKLGNLRDGLYHGQYKGNVRMFPFRSLRALIDAAKWPRVNFNRGLAFKGNHPEDLVANWTHQANGLTHDEDFWYSTQTFAISRIPKSVPLAEARDADVFSRKLVSPTGVAPGHAGAVVFSGGFLYVAVENTPWPGLPGQPGQVWVVDPATLAVVETFVIEPGREKAPWCAINEQKRLLYTSDFFDDDDEPSTTDQIRIYEFWPWPGPAASDGSRARRIGSLTLVTELGDPFPAEQVQAGIITPNNHLLIACDEPMGTAVSGLHLFDLMTGVRRWHTHWVDVDSMRDLAGINITKFDEAEGVTVWAAEGFYVHVLFGVKNAHSADGVKVMRLDTFDWWERDLL